MFVTPEILELGKEIMLENGEREEKLRAKCHWEHMCRSKVLEEYGDPKNWSK